MCAKKVLIPKGLDLFPNIFSSRPQQKSLVLVLKDPRESILSL